MSDVKISALPAAGPLTGIERVVLNQGGVTKTAAASSLIGGGTSGMRVFNITDYGAVGDGAHDATSAIQDAVTAAGSAPNTYGCVVYVPPGTYVLTDTITFPGPVGRGYYNGISLVGDGPQTSVLSWQGPVSDVTEPVAQRKMALNLRGQVRYRSGGFTLRNDSGLGIGTSVGILLDSDNPGQGTIGGQCTWDTFFVQGFWLGMQAGDITSGHAISEVLLIHPTFWQNGTGLYCADQNTISFALHMLELSGNGIGINSNAAQAIHVYGGSSTGQTICDFYFHGGGAYSVNGMRGEDTYFLTANGVTVYVSACEYKQFTGHFGDWMMDGKGALLQLDSTKVGGKIALSDGDTNIHMVGCTVVDASAPALPFYNRPGLFPYGGLQDSVDHGNPALLTQARYFVQGCWTETASQDRTIVLDQFGTYVANLPVGLTSLTNGTMQATVVAP